MDNTAPASATSTQPTTTIGDASAALALADSSLATPTETSTPASTTPADATVQPQTATPTPESVSTDSKGEPPKWRWQDILENARKTSAEEAEKRVRQETEQRYQWAKDIADHERNGLLVWRAAMNGDPQALAQIRANPQAVQWIKGLVQSEQPQQPQHDPEPEPDFVLPVRDAQGNIVGERPIYSAEQMAKREAWMKRNLLADVQKQIAPLQQVAQTFQQREQQAVYTTTVSSVLAKMKSADPQFEKHMPDVAAAIQADGRLSDLAMTDPETAIEVAYGRVYRSKVMPGQQAQTEADVLAKLKQQAVAGTVNPGAAAPSTPKQTLGDARAALAHATSVLGG